MIECAIATLLLTSCAVGLLKWTQNSAQLSRKANTHLAASLVADNAALRLSQSTLKDAATDARRIASQLTSPDGFIVKIDNHEFTTGNQGDAELRGVHFTINVTARDALVKITHAWILESPGKPLTTASATAAGETDSAAPAVTDPTQAEAGDLD